MARTCRLLKSRIIVQTNRKEANFNTLCPDLGRRILGEVADLRSLAVTCPGGAINKDAVAKLGDRVCDRVKV